MPPYPLPLVIFAGGKSSRMGRDKALLPFAGYETLAEYQYRRLRPLFSDVFISAKSAKFPFDAPLVLDAADLYAPTAGLLAVYEAMEGDFFALGVDTPFVDERVFSALYDAYTRGGADAVVARTAKGGHPLCAIYTRNLLPALRRSAEAGRHRLHALLNESRVRWVDFDDERLFYNMNTPDQYESARRRGA
ncbi:molybdenum cofactor guanylyltransferase MobA [Hydrogenimonas sp.]